MKILRKKKKCSRCGKEKSLYCFPKDKYKKDGLYSSCSICHNNRYAGEKHKQYRQNCKLKENFNITLSQYTEMLKKQNGVCAICGGINKSGYALAVDHDHKTGKIRKLLCGACNAMIANSRENILNLESGIKYLKEVDSY